MAGFSDVMWIVGSYIVVIILIYATLNFLTKGFIRQYLKVKTSRGRLTLIKCYDVTDNYYRAGKIDNKRNLLVKDNFGKLHTFCKVDFSYVARELGVNLIEVDLVKGLIIKKHFEGQSAFDLTMLDEMVNRALMLPRLKKDQIWENLQKLMFIIMVVGIGVCIYLLVTLEPTCNCSVASAVGNI